MLRYEVVLGNDEIAALAPLMEQLRTDLANKMMGADVAPWSKAETAYAALGRLFGPAREHLARLKAAR